MEQRNQSRKAANLGAVVSCPQFGLFRGQIDNLSLKGAFVRANSVSVCLNAPVTVTFQPDPDQPLLTCNAHGKVVRQGRNGVGIRFSKIDEHCRRGLKAILDRLPDTQDSASGIQAEPELLAS